MPRRRSRKDLCRSIFFPSFIAVFASLIFSGGLFGQIPDTLWTRTYGSFGSDYFLSGRKTADSCYIVSGTYCLPSGYRAWLLKFDPAGDTLWTRTYGLNSTVNLGFDVVALSGGGFAVAGYTVPFGSENYDFLLIKTDPGGDTLWVRHFGGDSADLGLACDETPDRGCVVTGYTESFGVGATDLWVIKVDSLGDWVFARTYGGSFEESGNAVQTTADSGFILAGYNCSFSLHGMDGWLLKLDAQGDTVWTRSISNGFYDNFYSVRQLPDAGYIVTGWTALAESASIDLSLTRTDPLGNVLWTRIYGGIDTDAGFSVEPTPDRGFIVAGITYSFGHGGEDIWILKTDSLGDTLWTLTLGGGSDDESQCVAATSDFGYLVSGYTSSWGSGYFDGWLVKLGYPQRIAEEKSPAMERWCALIGNPARGRIEFNINLASSGSVDLKIYDAVGRLRAKPFAGRLPPGQRRIEGRIDLPAGVYFYRLESESRAAAGKFIVIR